MSLWFQTSSLQNWEINSVIYESSSLWYFAAWTICMGVDLFEFILSGTDGASWMCRLMFVIKFGKFSAIISYNNLLCSFLSFSYFHIHMLVCLISHISLRFCSFSFILFSLSSTCIFSTDLSLSTLILSSANSELLLSKTPLVNLPFQVLYLQVQNLHFGFLYFFHYGVL